MNLYASRVKYWNTGKNFAFIESLSLMGMKENFLGNGPAKENYPLFYE